MASTFLQTSLVLHFQDPFWVQHKPACYQVASYAKKIIRSVHIAPKTHWSLLYLQGESLHLQMFRGYLEWCCPGRPLFLPPLRPSQSSGSGWKSSRREVVFISLNATVASGLVISLWTEMGMLGLMAFQEEGWSRLGPW